jgi:hypothetical protein
MGKTGLLVACAFVAACGRLDFESRSADPSADAASTDGAAASTDATDPTDAAGSGAVALANVQPNRELATGFIVGTAPGVSGPVGCQFDGEPVVVATGSAAWKCARPPSWAIGSRHVVTVGLWNGSTLSSTVTATVYAGQNHDFNGDGYPDLAIGAPFANSDSGTVSIYYGSPAGIAATADLTIPAPSAASMFGYALVIADVRGTGYADLVVGLASFSTSFADPGNVYVFDGGSAGLAAAPSYQLGGPALNAASGGYSLAAGDYNGDGFQDLAVGYGAYNSFAGAVYFYKGGAAGATLDAMKTGTGQFGLYVGLADLYGSGYASAVVGQNSGTGVYQGGPSGIAAAASTSVSDVGALSTAYIKRSGFADLVISGNAQAVIYYGGASGPSAGPTVTDPPAYGWGTVITGDVDLDGYDDVVFANPCLDASCATGSVLVFRGGSAGGSTTATTTLTNPGATSEFGYSLGLSDVNGDGHLDLFVGTNGAAVYEFPGTGTAAIFPAMPTATIALSDVAFSPH